MFTAPSALGKKLKTNFIEVDKFSKNKKITLFISLIVGIWFIFISSFLVYSVGSYLIELTREIWHRNIKFETDNKKLFKMREWESLTYILISISIVLFVMLTSGVFLIFKSRKKRKRLKEIKLKK